MKPAVLFVNSFWTKNYNGTEEPSGNFSFRFTEEFKRYGASDEKLFVADKNGIHHCGLGRGAIRVDNLDAVFVATDPSDNQHKIVAIFQNLSWRLHENGWVHGQARSEDVICFPVHQRPRVTWQPGQHTRRWADRWKGLKRAYNKIIKPQQPPSSGKKRLLELYRCIHSKDKKRLIQQIARAVRDQELRPAVLKLWGSRCAACGLQLETRDGAYECEVAHIHQVREQGPDSPKNALPLCRTHHWAFDQHLWSISPKSMRMSVHEEHRKNPVLADLHGAKLKPGKKGAQKHLDMAAVQLRWHHSGLKEP